MPNLRILYDNAADRAASLTASTTSGTLVAANMKNDIKSSVHRSTGTSVTYTLTWTTSQTLGAVVLPVTNLSSSATIRIRCYSDTNGTALVRDTGVQSASSSYNVTELFGTLSVNTFNFGGYTKVAVWIPDTNARRLVIDLVDTSNPAGFIDCSRIVAGQYWQPNYNFEPNALKDTVDTSDVRRAQSGDLRVDTKPKYEKLSFSFSYLPEQDYLELLNIIALVGVTKNVVVSLLPEFDTKGAEDSLMIYGKLQNTSTKYAVHKYYKSSLDIQSW